MGPPVYCALKGEVYFRRIKLNMGTNVIEINKFVHLLCSDIPDRLQSC